MSLPSSERETVPRTGGRAERPSSKKLLASSGLYFGCCPICCLHPAERRQKVKGKRQKKGDRRGRRAAGATACSRLLPLRVACRPFAAPSVENIVHLKRVHASEQVGRLLPVELRVVGLDAEEEPVLRGAREALHAKERVIRHRQAAQRQHAEDREERREQNRQLERDRDVHRPTVR